MDGNALKIENISKHYAGIYALKNASLEFVRGEIHSLLGENGAGKSTLCKILSGAIAPDEGTITVRGKNFHTFTPSLAKEEGIGMIYQEFNLVPEMTVYENLFLGKEIRKGLDVNKAAMIKKTKEIFEELGIEIDPMEQIKNLSVAYCQLIEIGKAILEDAEFLIMDEPTATLTMTEVDALFKLIKKLKQKEVTIVYISHRINELLDVTDRITVMRDGELIQTLNTADTNRAELIKLMVGRELGNEFPEIDPATVNDEVILKVENLTTDKITNISFELHRGEILGLAGLVGAGRSETLRAIFGIDPILSGKVYVYGKETQIDTPRAAIKHGLAMIPEDRKREGVHLELPIKTNISLLKIENISKWLTINSKKEETLAEKYVNTLSIKIPSLNENVSSLSGGNQQKVVVSKWMSLESDIIFFDEPTRGIDVGTKKEIYELMDALRKEGKGIIMISSEMTEIIGMCNRAIIMYEGIQKGELTSAEFSQEGILELASGGDAG